MIEEYRKKVDWDCAGRIAITNTIMIQVTCWLMTTYRAEGARWSAAEKVQMGKNVFRC